MIIKSNERLEHNGDYNFLIDLETLIIHESQKKNVASVSYILSKPLLNELQAQRNMAQLRSRPSFCYAK